MKPAGSYKSLLSQAPFIAYLISQFFTAFNDNVFKIVVMLIALRAPEGGAGSGYVDSYYISAQFLFILPFFLFSGYSGYFTDRYPKNRVIIGTKLLEVVIMLIALYFMATVNKAMLVALLFLLSTQSVFLSPAKYGILPEWFSEEEISRVNGLVELFTFLAIIFGSAMGGILMQYLGDNILAIGLIILALAIVGFAASFFIKKFDAPVVTRKLSINPWHETYHGIKIMLDHKLIATTIAGISFFFAIALAAQTNLLVFGKEIFGLNDLQIGLMTATIGLGIGLGSIAAGWLSGDKIEFGLIPAGAIGMTIGLFLTSYTTDSVFNLYLILILTGFSAGLFIVPLNALIQELPAKKVKGQVIATNNFFNGLFMLVAVAFIWFLQSVIGFKSDQIMFVLGFVTLLFSIITLSFNPRFFVRFIILLFVHIFYKINVIGRPNIPREGPALIVSNHVSYIDGLILSSVFPRFLRYLAHKYYYNHPLLHGLFKFAYAIPIEGGNEKVINESIARARKALEEGHVVCIFAEGRLTRTGNLLPFRSGLEKIVEGLDVPIIPVYLDQLWESIFSPRKSSQVFRVPQQFPARVSVILGDPMPSNSKAWQVRQAVQELAVQARVSKTQQHFLPVEFLKTATNAPFRECIYEFKNKGSSCRIKKHKFSDFSSIVLYLAHKLKKTHEDDQRIGLLLPASYEAALLNVALTMAGKSVVNIPSDYSYEDILTLRRDLNVSTIYTTRELTLGESLLNEYKATDSEKILKNIHGKLNSIGWHIVGVLKYILPVKWVLKFIAHLPDSSESEVAVIVNNKADSKEGHKYIRLSHESIYSNISGLKQVFEFNKRDKISSTLDFSNPYIYTSNLWGSLVTGICHIPVNFDNTKSADNQYKQQIAMLHKNKATVLIIKQSDVQYFVDSMPANLIAYFRYIICIDDSLDYASGYYGLNEILADEFFDKFSLRLLTGFGSSDLGPYISVNIPDVKARGMLQRGYKRNSVGHPLPNVAVRVVDSNNQVLEPGSQGNLQIKTPGYMMGYGDASDNSVNPPQQEYNVDQWFNTHLIATIDEEGFIFINS